MALFSLSAHCKGENWESFEELVGMGWLSGFNPSPASF